MTVGAQIPYRCSDEPFPFDVLAVALRRKAPRYDHCKPATAAASKAKSHNPPKGTKAELVLRRALWAKGLRYRLHAKDLPGKPDIVFRSQRLAIFVDGDFWHGRNWLVRRRKLAKGSNAGYWLAKIGYNVERDKKNAALLQSMGWTVKRFWETDLLDRPEIVVRDITDALALLCRRE